MLRKLKYEYGQLGLRINKAKKYLGIYEENYEDLYIETTKIKHCKTSKYLVVSLSNNDKSTDDQRQRLLYLKLFPSLRRYLNPRWLYTFLGFRYYICPVLNGLLLNFTISSVSAFEVRTNLLLYLL